jgi:serine O-acetyltransferase
MSRRAVCLCVHLRLICRTGAVAVRMYIDRSAKRGAGGFRVLDWRMDMAPDGVSSRGDLWLSIRREAETALAYDPIFGRSLSASILDHPGLGAAVSHQIGQRLGKSTGDRHQFERAANEAFAASPDLVDAASRDLEVIALNDPASTGPLPVLLNFKGYVALQTWRVSNWLWHQNRRDLALLLQSESSDSLQVSIHPSASIGTSVFLDHATGIVVGSFVTIGDEVTIQQNVTVGRKAESLNRAPRIGRGVLLSTGGRPFSATSASVTLPRSARVRS